MTFNPTIDDVETLIVDSYLESARKQSFNGLPALSPQLVKIAGDERVDYIKQLVMDRSIDCVWDVNPYIKRFPELPVDKQLNRIDQHGLNDACLYPSKQVLRHVVGADGFRDMPFSRALALGEAQLSFVAFEMAVLQRYREDPRYRLVFYDYMGDTYISDAYYKREGTLERDHIGVQSFGLGFDDNDLPHIIVFYRYLANMTPAHQQYWRSFTSEGRIRMSDPYFQSSIAGDWWENRSGRFAIAEEMRLINELCEAQWSSKLFRHEMEEDLIFELTAFLVPSSDAFGRFIHAWDKLLSDNINKRFFKGKIGLIYEEHVSPGRIREKEKGTLALLEEWLASLSPSGAEEAAEVLVPLRNVRKLRQKPAHSFSKNSFSKDFHTSRVGILKDVHGSMRHLRRILAKAGSLAHTSVPSWLDGEEIDFF